MTRCARPSRWGATATPSPASPAASRRRSTAASRRRSGGRSGTCSTPGCAAWSTSSWTATCRPGTDDVSGRPDTHRSAAMDLLSTMAGSMMEGFFPAGWDLRKIDALAADDARFGRREAWWHPQFEPVACDSFEDFDTYMGHEIAREVQQARSAGRPVAFILPVGPMGMYRWSVYFLREWDVPCDHVHGFNMDEWSDSRGNTLHPQTPGAFPPAMEQAFYGPLGERTVPRKQRHFALKDELPTYAAQVADLKKQGAKLVTVFGIGRVCHIAFWEPHFASEFASEQEWRAQTHRLGA